MKKSVAILGVMTFGVMMLGGHAAHAATQDATHATTQGSVTFTLDDTPITPSIDPDQKDPDGDGKDENGKDITPIDPSKNDGVVNSAKGDLTLDYVSNFRFGNQKFDNTKDVNSFEAALDNTHSNFVQVSDKRSGNAGWTLTATASALTDASNELGGSSYTLTVDKITNSIGSATPSATTSGQEIVLGTDGSAVTVMGAKNKEGMGTSIETFKKVTLNVATEKANAQETNYNGNIAWELTDAPA